MPERPPGAAAQRQVPQPSAEEPRERESPENTYRAERLATAARVYELLAPLILIDSDSLLDRLAEVRNQAIKEHVAPDLLRSLDTLSQDLTQLLERELPVALGVSAQEWGLISSRYFSRFDS